MSLSILDISEFGVVAVADTAITEELLDPQGLGAHSRVLSGARKLFAHPASRSLITVWGAGMLPGARPVQFVIQKFLDDYSTLSSPREIADEIAFLFKTFYGAGIARLGIDVVGFERLGSALLPALYEVRNFSSSARELKDFEVEVLRKPAPANGPTDRMTYAGGDDTLWRPLHLSLSTCLEAIKSAGLIIPADSLQARREFFAAQIRFISDLYSSGRVPRTISESVLAASIDVDGFVNLP